MANQNHDHTDHIGHAPAHHQSSLLSYFVVFLTLMVLTIITVWVSRIDLGALNTSVAMAIAIVKATVVILWFMHVIHSPRLTWIIVIASFLWLAVMFVMFFADYATRGFPLS
ncbi:MAG TPA: cytochrome C oxidase subunit IV family protein [Thermoanaerobaculia bacterium]|jgi:cytochrome c oxidase subunit 4|nr:cytochrome C oxidase subunit IV family protein [Thermoanaerobaculia bacterium]